MPGGRLEPGETAAEAASGSCTREIGLEVRSSGSSSQQPSWRVPGLRDENHFVSGDADGADAPAEWEHEVQANVFRCRWVPLTADTQVYGKHGAFLRTIMRNCGVPDC